MVGKANLYLDNEEKWISLESGISMHMCVWNFLLNETKVHVKTNPFLGRSEIFSEKNIISLRAKRQNVNFYLPGRQRCGHYLLRFIFYARHTVFGSRKVPARA